MEKYRKFDDPACGINPFTPLPETSRPTWMKLLRIPGATFLTFIKVPFVFFLLLFALLANIVRALLFFAPL